MRPLLLRCPRMEVSVERAALWLADLLREVACGLDAWVATRREDRLPRPEPKGDFVATYFFVDAKGKKVPLTPVSVESIHHEPKR